MGMLMGRVVVVPLRRFCRLLLRTALLPGVMVMMLIKPTVAMSVASGDERSILCISQTGQLLQESHQIPDMVVFHSPFGPSQHAGSLDAVLDDPELPCLRKSAPCDFPGSTNKVGRLRVEPKAKLRVFHSRGQMAADAHGIVVASPPAHPLPITQVTGRLDVSGASINSPVPGDFDKALVLLC